MKPIQLLLALSLFVIGYPVNAESNTDETKSPVKTLTWAGCGITKKAFMQDIAKQYEADYGVRIELQGGGATKGIRAPKKSEVHLGGTCRIPLLTTEESSMMRKMKPVAWDALVVIVHPDMPISTISTQELKKVLNGQIKDWRDLEGWEGDTSKAQPLKLYTRASNLSGVGFTMRKLLFGNYEQKLAAAKTYPSSGPLEKAIEKESNALAVSGVSSARKRNVKMLNLDGLEPNFDNIKSGEYQLYRPLHITHAPLYKLPDDEKDEVKRFLDYLDSDKAKEIIRANQVVPYSDGWHLMQKRRDLYIGD